MRLREKMVSFPVVRAQLRYALVGPLVDKSLPSIEKRCFQFIAEPGWKCHNFPGLHPGLDQANILFPFSLDWTSYINRSGTQIAFETKLEQNLRQIDLLDMSLDSWLHVFGHWCIEPLDVLITIELNFAFSFKVDFRGIICAYGKPPKSKPNQTRLFLLSRLAVE